MTIVVTSLSPSHFNVDNQHIAIESWKDIGDIYSLNTAKEIKQIKSLYKGICFIETDKTIEHLIYKCLVNINEMINLAISLEKDLLLINSDIILYNLPELKDDGITIFSRYNYSDCFENCEKFDFGFDVFHIPLKFLSIFPQTIFAMGSSHWDHWLPMVAIQHGIKLYYPKGIHAYHKLHQTQYSFQEWEYMGQYFKKQFMLEQNLTIPQIATMTLAKIKAHLI